MISEYEYENCTLSFYDPKDRTVTTYHMSIGVEYSVDPSNTSGGLYLKIKDI